MLLTYSTERKSKAVLKALPYRKVRGGDVHNHQWRDKVGNNATLRYSLHSGKVRVDRYLETGNVSRIAAGNHRHASSSTRPQRKADNGEHHHQPRRRA